VNKKKTNFSSAPAKKILLMVNSSLELALSFYRNSKWKIEIFFLALQKFAKKIIPILLKRGKKTKTQKKLVHLFPAKSKNNFSLKKYLFVITAVLVSIVLTFFYETVIKDLPSPNELTKRNIETSTKIYDRNNQLLYTIYKDKNRTIIPLSKIPKEMRSATIASEDSSFYIHPGFSVKGIIRSVIINLKQGELTGGSTITQQLVKNALLSPEKTLIRKLKEFILAIEVEKTYSKDQILEMYLNEVPFGGTAYGIEEASQMYFGKKAENLTLGESAILASLPQSPTKFSPFGSNSEVVFEKQKEVLRRMKENGFISENQMNEAINEKISFSKNKTPIKAPHFVFYVRGILEEKYGKALVEQGGLNVVTSLDLQIQTLAENVVKEEVDKLKNLNVTNAAVIVMNPKNGEILAMVGSKDYFDLEHDGNVNVTLRQRQPGSSIKVVNYIYALSNGLTPVTIIPDTPVTFLVDGQPPYTPKNYEGEFRGNITLRDALAQSRNIPAVKVLSSYGVEKMVELGKKMGITTWLDPKNYGLSLTLGGGEVKLIDLSQVYAVIANKGKKVNIQPLLKVSDSTGKKLEEYSCQKVENIPDILELVSASNSATVVNNSELNCGGTQIIDTRVAFLITDILKDNNARSPSFGSNSLLVIKNHPEVAVKTGTSNDLKDNLAIGYTNNVLVAVWIGNNDNSQMSRIASGVTGATPIFNKIMTAILMNQASIPWNQPKGIVQQSICPYTGTLSCDGCPVKTEWFLEENKLNKACSPEWFNKTSLEAPPPSPSLEVKIQNGKTNGYFENIFKLQMDKIKKKLN
jgi:1A family penicillin-binding protein